MVWRGWKKKRNVIMEEIKKRNKTRIRNNKDKNRIEQNKTEKKQNKTKHKQTIILTSPLLPPSFPPPPPQGRDKQGRPLIFKEFGHCHIHNLVPKHTTVEQLNKYHVWCNEKYAEQLAKNSQDLGLNIETFCLVVDAKGWHIGLTSKAAYAFLRFGER